MIDWNRIKHFKREKFSEDPDRFAEPELLYSLDKFREIQGGPIYPSPVSGALARFSPKAQRSQHFCGDGIRSRAVDIFPGVSPQLSWTMAVSCGIWGGVGLYPFTKFGNQPHAMLHLDIRPRKRHGEITLWFVDSDGEYYYPLNNDSAMRRLMQLIDRLGTVPGLVE